MKSDKQKAAVLSVIVLTAALCGLMTLTLCLLQRTTLRLEEQRLHELVHSHAVLIEEFFHIREQVFKSDQQEQHLETVLTGVFNAHLHEHCFGESGEFLLARQEGEQIVFWPGQKHLSSLLPPSVPLDSPLAEPMRLALSGQRGTMTGLDYRGRTVLAAYQWVPEMRIGLVAKIDLAEVRRPLFQAGAIAGGAALLLILAGSFVLLRFNPFLRRLEEEKRLAQNYLDIAGAMIAVLDQQGRLQLINRQGCEILGGEQEGLLGLFWVEHCVQEEDRQQASAALQRLLDGKEEQIDGLELHLRRIDGGQRIIDWSGRTLRDRRGHKIGAICSGADMTAKRQSEQSLHEAQEAFQSTFEQAAVGIAHVAPDGRLLRVNRRLCAILGYPQEELLAKTIMDITHPDHKERSYAKAINLAAEPAQENYSMEKQYLHRNGNAIWVNHTVSLVRDSKGYPLYYISVIEDIQARKAMEAVLHERTALLVRSNKELDDFAYIASHDLKEPLRGIMSYSTFLLEDYGETLGSEGRDRLKTMGDLAGRLSDLTDDLLTFSRVGRLALACRAVDLNQLVEDVLITLRVGLEEDRVTVRIAKPLPTIICDAVRMREVYYNLITNAARYNDKEDKWVEIGALHPWNDPKQLLFYVCDNGIGIRDKHLGKIFTMFKRLNSGNKYGRGTGAGLAIVKKIIERHDGHIWVESAEGEGTVFFFTLVEKPDCGVWLDNAADEISSSPGGTPR
ncbi:histidine kinase [Candidatus Electronema halotolerans]